jgi:hypothetical protein
MQDQASHCQSTLKPPKPISSQYELSQRHPLLYNVPLPALSSSLSQLKQPHTMAVNIQHLHDIPQTFARRAYPRARATPRDQSCPICLRPYGKVDPSSPNDPPCHGQVLCPRGHLIGSACAQDFAASDAARRCPHCRTRIAVADNAIHKWYLRWLKWIATSEWFVSKDCTTFAGWSNAEAAQLRKDLSEQTLTLSDACHVWAGHVCVEVVQQAPVLFLFILVIMGFALLDAYCYPRSPEQMIMSLFAGIENHSRMEGHTISWCNCVLALALTGAWKLSERLQHVPLHTLAGVIVCRLEYLLIGISWTLRLTLVPAMLWILLYAVICAVLIAHRLKPYTVGRCYKLGVMLLLVGGLAYAAFIRWNRYEALIRSYSTPQYDLDWPGYDRAQAYYDRFG